MAGVQVIDEEVLAAHPLPEPAGAGDKRDRGTTLVIGGSVETPGALLLAGLAALRAGAGRLQMGLVAPDASALAVAVPEAMVMALGCDGQDVDAGELAPLREAILAADAVLLGPGATDSGARRLLDVFQGELLETDAILVIDAAALSVLADDPHRLRDRGSRTLLIPNQDEARQILDPRERLGSRSVTAAEVVERTGCFAVVRGPETCVRGPDGRTYLERSGAVGLATSGSGDVFAGLVTGYLARGADLLTASLWSVHVHAVAGLLAADRHGPVNFLARDLCELVSQAQRHSERT